MFFAIGDIKLPPKVQEAMQMQVEAERKKRAQILDSEGTREAQINVAEGAKRSQILASGKITDLTYLLSVTSVSHLFNSSSNIFRS